MPRVATRSQRSDALPAVLDIDGLAEYLHLSKSTAYRLAQRRQIPGQKVGKHWRFSRAAIDGWLAAGNAPVRGGGVAAHWSELEKGSARWD
jgi:excisionase family DNA binding protein